MSDASQNIQHEVYSLNNRLRDILHFNNEDKNIDFFISSLTEFNPHNNTKELAQWLNSFNDKQYFNVQQIPLDTLDKWSFDEVTGDLKHDLGGYFSIRGLHIETNRGNISSWSQPIIYQPEIGILGIITKKFNGILYFLLQAKAEPGNINTYQLSPTVQATKSNYEQLHGGKPTLYLNYFFDHSNIEVLIDQLQSEQGARFYHKRNRNMIIRLPDDYKMDLNQNYRWFSLGQIIRLSQMDNTVNMDTRSVLSNINYEPENIISKAPIKEDALEKCLSELSFVSEASSIFGTKIMISSHSNSNALHTSDIILKKITRRKFECILNVQFIPLKNIKKWVQTAQTIYHPDRSFFSVIGVRIEATNREIPSWDQPIIKQDVPGIVGFIIKEIDGVIHFMAQLKSEIGVMDLLEISPTVQCITSNYEKNDMPLFVNELLHRNNSKTITDVLQSEEGGRFYKESNQNIILLADDSFQPDEGDDFIWMTLGQLKELIKFNNFLNVEARSLMACLATSCYE